MKTNMLLTLPLLCFAARAVSAFPDPLSDLWSRAVTAQAYVTNNNGTYNLSSFPAPIAGSGTAPSGSVAYTLQVVDTTTKQSIVGFGAAVTDATTSVISGLSAAMQQQLWNTLMTPGTTGSGLGANFSLIRHTIGASDLSAPPAYAYDDNNGQPDTNLSNFALGPRGTLMAQTLQTMKTYQSGMRILGTPWSPPAWMKNNKNLGGGSTTASLNSAYYSQHAQYFVQYLNAFAKYVPIDAITIQNEPLNYKKSGLPSMFVNATNATDLIKNYIGPAIQSASHVPQIWAYDHNTDVPSYPATVLNGTGSFVQAAAWHCYSTTSGWDVLTSFHQQFPTYNQYMTECSTVDPGHWYGASEFTIGPLQNWANGVMSWTLATNTNDGPNLNNSDSCSTCQGLVIVDTAAGTYSLTTKFWTMAQYSRFMPRGALVMDVNGGVQNSTGAIRSVATSNPDGTTTTIVVENTFNQDLSLSVTFASGAQSYTGLVVKNSVTTWVLPK